MDMPAKEYLFGSIFLLSNKLQVLGDSYLEEITLKQWFLLIMMKITDQPHPSVSEVADLIGSTRQNIRKMLGALEAKGYVSLTQNEQDKRTLCVALTPQTHRFFERFQAKGDVFLTKLFEDIDPIHLKATCQTFEKLFENMERMEQEHV